MKAVVMKHAGGVESLQIADIAEPLIQHERQIKVKLAYAGVNPIDTKLRRNGVFYPDAYPAVLGCDGAGVVVETGSAVARFKPGDEVWFCHGGLGGDQGNYAEYNVLDERFAALKPKLIGLEEAAASPLVLITAWGALYDRGCLAAGQTVLIHAGAGGVGHVAIQLAKRIGAKVIATVSSSEKESFVRSLGADEVINYHAVDFVAAANELTEGQGCDLVFDTVGPEVFAKSISCTAHFGRIVTLLDIAGIDLKEARMRNLNIGFELMLTPMLRDLHTARNHQIDILERCGQWMDQQKLKTHVTQILPLESAAVAHSAIEEGHVTGKIVLKI